MESFVWTVAGGLLVAAIVGIVGSAFLRPKLFMGLYPNILIGCLVGISFGAGLLFGGKPMEGFTLIAACALGAFLTWLVLLPMASTKAQADADQ